MYRRNYFLTCKHCEKKILLFKEFFLNDKSHKSNILAHKLTFLLIKSSLLRYLHMFLSHNGDKNANVVVEKAKKVGKVISIPKTKERVSINVFFSRFFSKCKKKNCVFLFSLF